MVSSAWGGLQQSGALQQSKHPNTCRMPEVGLNTEIHENICLKEVHHSHIHASTHITKRLSTELGLAPCSTYTAGLALLNCVGVIA